MSISSLVVSSAEEITQTGDDAVESIVTDEDDNTRAYELVWKFKSSGGHLYKRRWNATLGGWYDPDWILVY